MVFDVFSILIFFLLIVIVSCIVRVVFRIQFVKQQGFKNYLILENQLKMEIDKEQKNKENIILANRFYDSIMLKLFKITNELLLIQKLIFDKQP
jgi:hypothetical protein